MAKQDLLTSEDEDNKPVADEFVITEEDPSKKPAPKAEPEDDEDDADERLSGERDVNPNDPDDKEREAIRERRRLEKIERKERRDKAMARDKVEMDFLRKRNDDLERRISSVEQRTHQADVSVVEQRLREALNEVDMAEKVISKAVAAGNGDDVAQAMRYRDEAKDRATQLKALKTQAARPAPVQNEGLDSRTLAHANAFVKENSWYDPSGQDEDSAIVLAIDNALVRDGYNPASEDYWDELRKRSARRLPERFKESAAAPQRELKGGPALGSGREHAPTSTRKEVYISPERKNALIEAGVWDDPVLRMKYVRRYAEYDRQNRA